MMARTRPTMSSVEAPALLRSGIKTPRRPLARTMLVCGAKPSRTCATSPMVTVAPLTVLIGRLAISRHGVGAAVQADEQLLRAELRRARRAGRGSAPARRC